jgi:hypothetical protein
MKLSKLAVPIDPRPENLANQYGKVHAIAAPRLTGTVSSAHADSNPRTDRTQVFCQNSGEKATWYFVKDVRASKTGRIRFALLGGIGYIRREDDCSKGGGACRIEAR